MDVVETLKEIAEIAFETVREFDLELLSVMEELWKETRQFGMEFHIHDGVELRRLSHDSMQRGLTRRIGAKPSPGLTGSPVQRIYLAVLPHHALQAVDWVEHGHLASTLDRCGITGDEYRIFIPDISQVVVQAGGLGVAGILGKDISVLHLHRGERRSMSDSSVAKERKPRGFATMSPEKRSEIASKGGKAAHAQGTAHKWRTYEEAAAAGRIGGARSRRHPMVEQT